MIQSQSEPAYMHEHVYIKIGESSTVVRIIHEGDFVIIKRFANCSQGYQEM